MSKTTGTGGPGKGWRESEEGRREKQANKGNKWKENWMLHSKGGV
jgi:hypothetical protein